MNTSKRPLTVLAIIPARSGSKGVRNKNIRLLLGKPLISYAIDVALKSPSIKRVIVSTDDAEIAEIAKKYGAEVPFLRPAELAEDHVPDQPVFQHTLKWLQENEGYSPDYVLNLRCTTPLKTVEDVESVIRKITETKSDSVRTMTKVQGVSHPYWIFKEVGGLAKPFIGDIDHTKYYQRQLLPPAYRINGVVDAIKSSVVLKSPNFYGSTMSLVEIPEERSHDIDTEFDFKFIEFLMKTQKQNEVEVEGKTIGFDYPVYVIAEAGVNHNGMLGNALKMIDVAADCGADAIKFQTFNTSSLITKDVAKAPYQKEATSGFESQVDMLQKLEIDEAFHLELIKRCQSKGITFLSTPYDETSLDLIVRLGVPAIKVASTDATNLLLLEKIARTGLPVILATGMCSIEEIEKSYKTLKENGCKKLALLKCTSNYPTSIDDVNLNGILTLARKFKEIVGFSDHTPGLGASPYAVAAGAQIIEKHFTLDKTMYGPDHRASLSPDELRSLIVEIRKVESMRGSSNIEPTESEIINKRFLQKCFVASKAISKGLKITREDICAKRTGGKGIPASEMYNILGRELKKDLSKDDVINEEDLLL